MFGKVFTSMFDGTLVSKGPWQALVTMQQLIVLADRDGVVDMTPSAISRRTSIPQEIIDVGLAALLAPDDESRTPIEGGRRIVLLEDHRTWGWRLVNHAKYTALRNVEERREYLRQAQEKGRSKKKEAAALGAQPSTLVNTGQHLSTMSTHIDIDVDVDVDKEKRKRKEKAPLALVIPDVSEQTLSDFLKLRKAKNAPFTATALAGIQREANKACMTLQDALAMACERGWTSFKSDWVKVQSRDAPTETAWQRSQRENVERATGGLLSRSKPLTGDIHYAASLALD